MVKNEVLPAGFAQDLYYSCVIWEKGVKEQRDRVYLQYLNILQPILALAAERHTEGCKTIPTAWTTKWEVKFRKEYVQRNTPWGRKKSFTYSDVLHTHSDIF